MKRFKYSNTPMSPSIKLNLDVSGKLVDQKLYKSIIGSLLYLIANRPNIMFCYFLMFSLLG